MEYIRILQWSLKGNFKETVWRNTRQTDQKHHEIQISVVLGKLDNIESLLKKHIIFVLLCFAQISQTLHVCGATMIFAYFFARTSGRRFTWVVCEIRSKHIRKNG